VLHSLLPAVRQSSWLAFVCSTMPSLSVGLCRLFCAAANALALMAEAGALDRAEAGEGEGMTEEETDCIASTLAQGLCLPGCLGEEAGLQADAVAEVCQQWGLLDCTLSAVGKLGLREDLQDAVTAQLSAACVDGSLRLKVQRTALERPLCVRASDAICSLIAYIDHSCLQRKANGDIEAAQLVGAGCYRATDHGDLSPPTVNSLFYALKPQFTSGRRVLLFDLGCGPALPCLHLAALGVKQLQSLDGQGSVGVIGVELVKERVAAGKEMLQCVKVWTAADGRPALPALQDLEEQAAKEALAKGAARVQLLAGSFTTEEFSSRLQDSIANGWQVLGEDSEPWLPALAGEEGTEESGGRALSMAVLNCAIYARDPTVWEGALKLLHEVQFDVVATTVPLSTRQAEWRKGALQARGDNPTAPALASLYSVPYIFMGNGSWAAGAVPVYVYL